MTQQHYEHRDRRPDLPFHEETHRSADALVVAICIAAGVFLVWFL